MCFTRTVKKNLHSTRSVLLMVFVLSNGCNSSLSKILQFQTKVAELFGQHLLLCSICMCISWRIKRRKIFNLNYFHQTFLFCCIIKAFPVNVKADFIHSHAKDKLFRIDSGCGKPEGDGLDFSLPVISFWFFLQWAWLMEYTGFTLVLTGRSLVIWNLIGSATGNI